MHIGPSPLGQALILPLASEAGFETCLIGREGSPLLPRDTRGRPTYSLRWEGAEKWEEPRAVRWDCRPGCEADLPAEVREALRSEPPVPVLITATLRKEGIEARHTLIREMLEVRPKGAETVVMPCENKVPDAWDKIEAACRACGADFVIPLVNRIAVPFECSQQGARITRTHPLGEWLVAPAERRLQILDALATAERFAVVGDLETRKRRKLYVVNGAHLAVGIQGVRRNRRSLRTTARMPENAYLMGELHQAMRQGLALGGDGLPDTDTYSREHFQAYCEVSDKVARIMAPLRRTDPRPFLESVEERLTAPAMLAASVQQERARVGGDGDLLSPYRRIFESLALVLEDLSAYSDAKTPRLQGGLQLDPEVDREALAVYRRCLYNWERASDVNDRVGDLKRHFATHHAVVAGLGG